MIEAALKGAVRIVEFYVLGKPVRRCDHILNLVQIEGLQRALGILAVKVDRAALPQHIKHVAEARRCPDAEIAVQPRSMREPVSLCEVVVGDALGEHPMAEGDRLGPSGRAGCQNDPANILTTRAISPLVLE